MSTPHDPRREPAPAGRRASESPTRAAWEAPKIVHHGSIRRLVRGISGFLTDTLGMPGMRKLGT